MVAKTDDRAFSDLAIAPGELLAEELEARGMTQRELADRTGRPGQKISEIINGKKSITYDTALELERVLGIPAHFWVNLEASYQLTKARLREKSQLEEQEDWLKLFPVRELRARRCIPRGRAKGETVAALLKFFGVASFSTLRQREEALLQYRITPKSRVSEGALWAWLQVGDIEAREIDTAPYNERRFLDALGEIRGLTSERAEIFIPRMRDLCASAGVAFVVVKQFPKSGANGVVRWLSTGKAMIQLSTKRGWTDIFWFTFFHEAKHVLDRQKKRAFVNGINDDPDAEAAANRFAQEMLISPDEWSRFVASRAWSPLRVTEFARLVGIHPGIVVGRLQHEDLIPHSNLNDLRTRFVWRDD
ncbi:MAG: HigA family addiction module antitoxin [Dehalococcoidia bacterium]|nr:HigA family addiction module antitoxin [Dehalococcoidia bacterium]